MKVTSAMLAGAFCSIIVWMLEAFGHLTIPSPVVASLTTLLTFFVHTVVPEKDLGDGVSNTTQPAVTALTPVIASALAAIQSAPPGEIK